MTLIVLNVSRFLMTGDDFETDKGIVDSNSYSVSGISKCYLYGVRRVQAENFVVASGKHVRTMNYTHLNPTFIQ